MYLCKLQNDTVYYNNEMVLYKLEDNLSTDSGHHGGTPVGTLSPFSPTTTARLPSIDSTEPQIDPTEEVHVDTMLTPQNGAAPSEDHQHRESLHNRGTSAVSMTYVHDKHNVLLIYVVKHITILSQY